MRRTPIEAPCDALDDPITSVLSGLLQLIIVFLCLLIFLAGAVTNNDALYRMAYLLGFVYAGVVFVSKMQFKRIVVERQIPARILYGETVQAKLVIRNGSPFPVPWVRLHDHLPLELTSPAFFNRLISLGPRETIGMGYELSGKLRGHYRIGPLSLSSSDPFGLTQESNRWIPFQTTIVYPKVVPVAEMGLPSRSPFGHLKTQQRLYEDPSRTIGVRDYQQGDSIRTINWKTSAATGSLKVRKLEPAMTLETLLLLNMNADEYQVKSLHTAVENAITVAASIMNHLISLRQETGILTNGVDSRSEDYPAVTGRATGLPLRKGRGHLIQSLELLACLQWVRDIPFSQFCARNGDQVPWGATIVIISPRLDDDLLDTAIGFAQSGHHVSFVFVDYESEWAFNQVRTRTKAAGFTAYRVWRIDDLNLLSNQSVGVG